jgi:hypothetical protein
VKHFQIRDSQKMSGVWKKWVRGERAGMSAGEKSPVDIFG